MTLLSASQSELADDVGNRKPHRMITVDLSQLVELVAMIVKRIVQSFGKIGSDPPPAPSIGSPRSSRTSATSVTFNLIRNFWWVFANRLSAAAHMEMSARYGIDFQAFASSMSSMK